ncbi:MAG TPA: serine/threonine-protein kinase [Luteimonas sp.]|nr:serine/threonine-protein kinase [Luteimonas sp.]
MPTDERDPDRTELLATRSPGAGQPEGDGLPRGTRIGRYRIDALLGRGGMGEVYRAEQLEPVHRTVALKLLRGQTLDARRKAHFEIERQVLAQMRHPAIAQIHDADTTPDGHPFFAMEFIDGQVITQYCESRALPLAQRIALFIEVCDGVQHAHQKGVIHRDLKPGNLLVEEVDGRAHAKIIDFGIATASTLPGTREVAGTPDYMSPEQAAGDQSLVDTRSDVYSLGVVLCELLTGQRPIAAGETVASDSRSLRRPSEQLDTLPPGEADRVASRQGQPLAAMRRVLRGELDWVVLKAMRHDRADRYPSAAALADDLRRFLDGRVVLAVPASRRYAWRKFARRHRAGLAAATIALVALVGGLALSLHGLMQAREQRQVAELRSDELKKVVDFQQSMLESLDMQVLGTRMGEQLERQVDAAVPAKGDEFRVLLARADTTDIARGLVDYGLLTGAEAALERDFADDPQLAAELRESVARVQSVLGLDAKAARSFASVADYRGATLGEAAPDTLRARRAQVAALVAAAEYDDAESVLQRSLPQLDRLPVNDPVRVGLELAQAEIVFARGDVRAARAMRQALLDGLLERFGEDDPAVVSARSALAASQRQMGEFDAAAGNQKKVVAARLRRLGPQHDDTLDAQRNLAVLHMLSGRRSEAVQLQEQVAQATVARYGSEHPRSLAARATLGTMYADSNQAAKALPLLQSVLEARERVLGREHPETVRTRLNLATTHARLHDYAGALPLEQQVIETRTRRLGERHPDTLSITVNHASTLRLAGRYDEALALLQEVAPRVLDVLGEKHPLHLAVLSIRSDTLVASGRHAEGLAAYREAVQVRQRVLGERHHETLRTVWELVEACRASGRDDEAERWQQRYLAPLLAADPDTLDEPLANLAGAIRSHVDVR